MSVNEINRIIEFEKIYTVMQRIPGTLMLIRSLKYFWFYIVFMYPLGTKICLYLISITILIEISSTNYIILIKKKGYIKCKCNCLLAWTGLNKNNKSKVWSYKTKNAQKKRNSRKPEIKSYSCKIPHKSKKNCLFCKKKRSYNNDIINDKNLK